MEGYSLGEEIERGGIFFLPLFSSIFSLLCLPALSLVPTARLQLVFPLLEANMPKAIDLFFFFNSRPDRRRYWSRVARRSDGSWINARRSSMEFGTLHRTVLGIVIRFLGRLLRCWWVLVVGAWWW